MTRQTGVDVVMGREGERKFWLKHKRSESGEEKREGELSGRTDEDGG